VGRIRSIKPEFPQSESMGRVSREARLLFVLLWTIVDDLGKARADSRLLASLLYPYDDDARGLIDGWLDELDSQGCLVRYHAEDHTYLQICNWLLHQKIDHPTPSRLPQFDEASRITRESSRGSPKVSDGIGLDWIGRDRKGEDLKNSACADSDIFGAIVKTKSRRAPRRKPDDRDPLRDALAESFKAKVPEYAAPAKENANLVRLASAIRRKAGADGVPEMEVAQGCVETFWRLHESGKPFYADFTPSKMLALLESLWADNRKRASTLDTSWMEA